LQSRNDERTIIVNDSIDNLTAEIQKKIRPSSIGIPMKRIQTSRRGKTIIEVENKEQLPILKEAILHHFPKADIDKPRKRRPQVTIFDIEPNLNIEEVIPDLLSLNPTITASNPNHYAAVLSLRPAGDEQVCTLECDPNLFKDIIKLGKINIGWNRCRVKENFYIPRCYTCQQLGHVRKHCKEKDKRCPRCSQIHEGTNCEKPHKCFNCTVNNQRSKTKFNNEHSSSDPKCPCIMQREGFLRSITSYA